MFSKNIAIIALGLGLLVPLATISESNQHNQPPITDEVVFLWDLHGVILKQPRKLVLNYLLFDPVVRKAMREIDWRTFKKLMKLVKKSMRVEGLGELYIHLARKHKKPMLEAFIHKLINTQRIIDGTFAIIKELSSLDYRHFVGSNIGKNSFAELTNKEKNPRFSELFSHFVLDKSHVVTYYPQQNELIKKPEIAYFTRFIQKNQIDLSKTKVIFIDNKLVNVQAAQAAGLIGVHFTSPKQLRRQLQALGIKLATTKHMHKKSITHPVA